MTNLNQMVKDADDAPMDQVDPSTIPDLSPAHLKALQKNAAKDAERFQLLPLDVWESSDALRRTREYYGLQVRFHIIRNARI